MTIRDPSKIPMTTHSRRPKIDVGLESSVLTIAASNTDIVSCFFAKTKTLPAKSIIVTASSVESKSRNLGKKTGD